MAVYIPDDWVKDKRNKQIVHDILGKYFYTDLRPKDHENYLELAKEELKRIGETIIIKKIEDGTIIIN